MCARCHPSRRGLAPAHQDEAGGCGTTRRWHHRAYIQISNSKDMRPHSRGAMRPRFCINLTLLAKRGRRESRMPIAPAVVRTKSARVDHRLNRITPAFPARMVYGLLRALPGDRPVCHRRLRIDDPSEPGWAGCISARLDASVGAPGPHDFAVRDRLTPKILPGLVRSGEFWQERFAASFVRAPSESLTGRPALRSRCAPDAVASIASHRAFVTSRDPPLIRVGRGELVMVICPTC